MDFRIGKNHYKNDFYNSEDLGRRTEGVIEPESSKDAFRFFNQNALDQASPSVKERLTQLKETGNIAHPYFNKKGDSLLHSCTEMNKIKYVFNLINLGMNLEVENKNGQTPLHIATIYGHYEIAHLLIKNGANVNAIDNDKNTPFHFILNHDTQFIFKFILNDIKFNDYDVQIHQHFLLKGANLFHTDNNNISPLTYILRWILNGNDERSTKFAKNIFLIFLKYMNLNDILKLKEIITEEYKKYEIINKNLISLNDIKFDKFSSKYYDVNDLLNIPVQYTKEHFKTYENALFELIFYIDITICNINNACLVITNSFKDGACSGEIKINPFRTNIYELNKIYFLQNLSNSYDNYNFGYSLYPSYSNSPSITPPSGFSRSLSQSSLNSLESCDPVPFPEVKSAIFLIEDAYEETTQEVEQTNPQTPTSSPNFFTQIYNLLQNFVKEIYKKLCIF